MARLFKTRDGASPTGRTEVRAATLAALAWTVVLAGAAAPLAAQYNAPGNPTPTTDIPLEETFEENIEEARWQLGGLRLSPWLGIREASFVVTENDQTAGGGREDDFTATVGAGLRGYLPLGSKAVWTGHALPEYVWWRENETKRSVNGRFGTGLFAYFNRLTFEASARRNDQQSFFSNEIQELTTTRLDALRLAVELEIARNLYFYGLAERDEYRSEEPENPIFAQLDRDEESVTLGLRLWPARRWRVGVSYTDLTNDFAANARDLSNTGRDLSLELGIERARWRAFALVTDRRLEAADASSELDRFDDVTGNLDLLWAPSDRLSLLGYARRDQTYSVRSLSSFILTTRQGLRLTRGARRATVAVFAELGEDDYAAVAGSAGARLDDVVAAGLDLRFDLRDVVILTLGVTLTDYDSNLDQFDRDVTQLGFALQLGTVIEKLSVGRPGDRW